MPFTPATLVTRAGLALDQAAITATPASAITTSSQLGLNRPPRGRLRPRVRLDEALCPVRPIRTAAA